MTANLRPMNLGEILDRTIQIYREKLLLFATLAAIPALGMMGLKVVNQFWWRLTPPYSISLIFGLTVGQLGFALATYHLTFLFQILVWPGFVYLSARTSSGEQTTLSAALISPIARWRSWLCMVLLFWCAVLVLPELICAGMFLGITYLMSEVAKATASTMEAVLPNLMIAFILLGWGTVLGVNAVISFAQPVFAPEAKAIGTARLDQA